MKIDLYAKSVLTLIAAALSVIAVGQFSSPRAIATPPPGTPKFESVTYDYGANSITFFDKSTGDLWYYGAFGSEERPQHEKLIALGEPLEKK